MEYSPNLAYRPTLTGRAIAVARELVSFKHCFTLFAWIHNIIGSGKFEYAFAVSVCSKITVVI